MSRQPENRAFLVDKKDTFRFVTKSWTFFSISSQTFTDKNLSAPLREIMNGFDKTEGIRIYGGLS
jgi:hypothetical protein